MAAPSGSVSDLESSSSSSSDAEELARCREAALPAWGLKQSPKKPKADAANNHPTKLPITQPSLRHKVDEHEQDGNELQTTPEFRAHVAKKLGALLDSSITISEVVKEPTKAGGQKKVDPEDDGFRLFFTSIPGGPEKGGSPPPRRKRLPSSSSSESSSEEWQRCREAAVSASDILQESAIHSPVETVGEEKKKKRKLKKKAKKEASADLSTAAIDKVRRQAEESAQHNGDQASLGTKKKKKKKKAERASEASPSPPVKSAGSACKRTQLVG